LYYNLHPTPSPMTQEKQYKHPTLIAIKNKHEFLYHIEKDGVIIAHSIKEEVLPSFWFVELPTTDTGKGDDWVYRLYRDRWDCLEKFREKLHYYMPKSVDLVWLTKEKIDELVELLMSYWGNYLARKKKFTEALAPYITGKQEQLMALDVEKVTKEIFDNIPTPYADWQMKRAKLYRIVKTILSKYWVHTQEEYEVVTDCNQLPPVKSTQEVSLEKVDSKYDFLDIRWYYHPVLNAFAQPHTDNDNTTYWVKNKDLHYVIWNVSFNKKQLESMWFIKRNGRTFEDCMSTPLNPPVPSTIEELADKIDSIIYLYKPFVNWEAHWIYNKEDIKELLSSLSPMGKKRTKQEVENIFSEEEREWYGDVRYEWAIMFLQKRWLLQE